MKCINPFKVHPKGIDPINLWKKYPLGYFYVPCGKCGPCRFDRAREWATRIYHEIDSWMHSSFVTLTYDDEHLPDKGTLKKRDLELFIKRLRKSVSPRKIRYYASGEYGENGTFRPHYHIILFGISVHDALEDCPKIWDKGFVHAGIVTYASARYVAQYIDKKYYDDLAQKVYLDNGLEVPFQVCSNGLGLEYAIKNRDQLNANMSLTIHGVPQTIPRYYKKKLDLDLNEFKKKSQQKLAEIIEFYMKKGFHSIAGIEEEIVRVRKSNALAYRTRKSLNDMKRRKL